MSISEIIMYNPWWNNSIDTAVLVKDLTEQYENANFKRDYSNLFDLSSNALYTLRGMRQIGKSTALKVTIAKLLKKNVPRKSIMFLPSDTVANFKELREILIEYLNYAKEYKKRYIFIDEISYVKDWQRAIKELRDNTVLRNDFMLLSGSSALDIKRGAERMPGRRGNVIEPDKVL
ncbi:MAG: ATP-binding protein, partial [Thermotogae bacterium]